MNRRRARGEGCVYQMPDGHWRGYLTIGPGTGGRTRRKWFRGTTKSELLRKLRDHQRLLDSGLPAPEERLTVGVLLDRYLADGLSPTLAEGTRDSYRWAIDKHLKPGLGHLRLRQLTPTDVETLLRAEHAAGLSASSVNRIRTILAVAIRWAEKQGWVYRNVAALADTPTGVSGPKRALTTAEAKRLFAALQDDPAGPLFLVMLGLGLRVPEARGLQWADLDLDARILRVEHELKRRDGQWVLGPTKTRQSRRALRIPDWLTATLRRHRHEQTANRLRSPDDWTDLDLVFTTRTGTPLDSANIRRDLRRITTRVGIDHLTPRDLRRSAVSLLSHLGVPLEEVADVVGHHGTRMTAEVYRQTITPVIEHAKQPMDDFFGDNNTTP
jgi:integrase